MHLQAGTMDTLIDRLPGWPDNIVRSSDGKNFWLCLVLPDLPLVSSGQEQYAAEMSCGMRQTDAGNAAPDPWLARLQLIFCKCRCTKCFPSLGC